MLCKRGTPKEAIAVLYQMNKPNIPADSKTYGFLLQACAKHESLTEGKLLHTLIVKSVSQHDVFVGNNLISMYIKCGDMKDAMNVFDRIPQRNVVSWTALISGYVQRGYGKEAMRLFNKMVGKGVKPNQFTLSTVVKACASNAYLEQGKQAHNYIIKMGFESDVVVQTALVHMYARCGSFEDARHVFDKMSERSTRTWNAMITGHAQNRDMKKALKLFYEMSERDVVSWTAVIAGYAQNGYGDESLNVFNQMRKTGMKSDSFIMGSVLSACADLAALELGRQFHAYVVQSGFAMDIVVGSALVDMYAKSGSMEDACQVFDKMPQRNEVSWNSIITGCAQHGRGNDAVLLFEQMLQAGIKPNEISFVGVLSACSHTGLVNEGRGYFNLMTQNYGIVPDVSHYTCMIDLLGRAGCLDEAENFINGMPVEPDVSVWGALLGACRIHGNTELAKRIAEHLLGMEVQIAGIYVLLSNIYAAAGQWDDAAKVRKLMKDRGVMKQPGYSWIEVKTIMHAFVAGETSHPQLEEIHEFLESLSRKMKAAGYVPNKNFVLQDVEDDEKELSLSHHSEKLAIAFGIINTNPGTTIRVAKNLRVCGDCHTVIKFISLNFTRKIVVRDANRFHHFKDGRCSCGDYW
jgi:pentatricopeptide repeat protein